MISVEGLFEEATGRKTLTPESYIEELPDFDFDIPADMDIQSGTRLTLENGKEHPVAYATIDLPWSVTKHTADRLGVPHIDLLPNNLVGEIKMLPFEEVDRPEVWDYIFDHADDLYHIKKWKGLVQLFDPRSVDQLAEVIGGIRPKVSETFTSRRIIPGVPRELMDDGRIIYQDTMLRLLAYILDLSLEEAEYIRTQKKNIDRDLPYYHISKLSWNRFCDSYDEINPHLMAKGHCLQVALIIMNQAYKLTQS